jgi:hypothetical protein
MSSLAQLHAPCVAYQHNDELQIPRYPAGYSAKEIIDFFLTLDKGKKRWEHTKYCIAT